MISSDKKVVQLLLELCVSKGVRKVVFSPGSRNAPLAIAADYHPEIETFVIHDERSAAFFALGLSQQLNEPVAICCTSGSAPANYYPAVVEAYYQQIPLIVLSADRPEEWIDQGDGQTIRQRGIFGQHARAFVQLSDKEMDENNEWFVQRELSAAFAEGLDSWKGPVHINVAFSEPLYNSIEIDRPKIKRLNLYKGKFELDSHLIDEWYKAMKCEKKMVIIGQLPPSPRFNAALEELSKDPSIVFLVENTANVKGQLFVHSIDRMLATIKPEEIDEFRPDVVISFGGAIVSKRIKTFLRESNLKSHWRIGVGFPFMDTFQQLTHSVLANPEDFLHAVNQLSVDRVKSNFAGCWKKRDFLAQEVGDAFAEICDFSDLKAIKLVLDFLPELGHLHMSNSSIVRYFQLFDPIHSVTFWSNRGTSGIDGSSSTAVGAAVANPNQLHVLVTGDVSFFYDSNALWNAYLPSNLRIILVNNGGGGIFRIIDGASSSPQTSTYFEAQHQQSAEYLTKTFDIDYSSIHSEDEFENSMKVFYQIDETNRPKLIEVFTPRDQNHLVLKEFFKVVSERFQ